MNWLERYVINDWYHSLTAHQHQKGSYSAKTSDNDCNVNSSCYSLRTALCESICYQAKSEQNVRQDLIVLIPRVRHGEAALCTPWAERNHSDHLYWLPTDLIPRVRHGEAALIHPWRDVCRVCKGKYRKPHYCTRVVVFCWHWTYSQAIGWMDESGL